MRLADHQRALFSLVWDGTIAEHPYLRAVASSPMLVLTREIALWWRVFGIEQRCFFTTALLKQRGRFEDVAVPFCHQPGLGAFIEPNGNAFLAHVAATANDELLRSIACFERALLAAAKGELDQEVIVEWDRDPSEVLDRLLDGEPADEARAGDFRVRVSRRLATHFEVL